MTDPRVCRVVGCEKKNYSDLLCYGHFKEWRHTLNAWMREHNVKPCPGTVKPFPGFGQARFHDGCCRYPAPWRNGAVVEDAPGAMYKALLNDWLSAAAV